MKRFSRLPWLVVLVLLVFALLQHVPGQSVPDAYDAPALSLPKLVVDIVDPLVLLSGLLVALLIGRWRGTRAASLFLLGRPGVADAAETNSTGRFRYRDASKTLAAGARGLLWGGFLMNASYLASCYWMKPPGLLVDRARLAYLRAGTIPVVLLACLVLLPAAERAVELSRRSDAGASRGARAVDAFAAIGLLACSLAVILSLFVYRAGFWEDLLAPTWGSIDASFVLWSAGMTIVLAWVALYPTVGVREWREAFRKPGRRRSRVLLDRLGRSSLAAGVLLAVVVQLAGTHRIASSGGNANPAELQPLAGGMLVPAVAGVVVAALLVFGPPLWGRRPAAGGPAPDVS